MKGLEGVSSTKRTVSTAEELGPVESLKLKESVENARKLRAQLEEFNNADVVGGKALEEVENIANRLSAELEKISAQVCLAEGLPYHPMDKKVV